MSWLWKSDSTSPASFEKALSKLSTQITAANLALDTTRSRARRSKALWTLYTTLTYLLVVLILTLVIGPPNWELYHYAVLLVAPALIYAVRQLITIVFDWRTGRQEAHLEDLQKQRETKITDLKKATKYDSTQELLQKYGGAPPPKQASSRQAQQGTKRKIASPQEPVQRTGIPPPPTANIPGRNMNAQSTPQRPLSSQRQSPVSAHMITTSPTAITPDEPGFAPNAFNIPPPLVQPSYEQGHHWYDRILDVLLGEDETAAKNRTALICQNCRLVNGQAPPGVKTLEEIGKWRCSSCGALNGVESESAKAVKQMAEQAKAESDEWEEVPKAHDVEDESFALPAESEGATGRDTEDSGALNKRVTRSAAKDEPLESLE